MTPKEKAKEIYDEVVREGMSTDYCYSPNFYKTAKQMAKQRAELINGYKGKELVDICSEIEKL